jgi:hypothetical protein
VAGWREGEGEMEDESTLLGHAQTGKDHPTGGSDHRRPTVTVTSLCTVSHVYERPVQTVKRGA